MEEALQRRLVAQFAIIEDKELVVLQDDLGWLSEIAGPLDSSRRRKLGHLSKSSYVEVRPWPLMRVFSDGN